MTGWSSGVESAIDGWVCGRGSAVMLREKKSSGEFVMRCLERRRGLKYAKPLWDALCQAHGWWLPVTGFFQVVATAAKSALPFHAISLMVLLHLEM